MPPGVLLPSVCWVEHQTICFCNKKHVCRDKLFLFSCLRSELLWCVLLFFSFPPGGASAIHLNMTSEWNEFPLKVAVSVSLNWTLLLEVLLICSDISISSCYPGLVSAGASPQLVFTPRLYRSVPSGRLLQTT